MIACVTIFLAYFTMLSPLNILLSNRTYELWEIMFHEWENGNILDELGKLPMGMVAPIGKSTFNYLVGLHESHMATFAQGLLNHKFMLWERSAKFKGEVHF